MHVSSAPRPPEVNRADACCASPATSLSVRTSRCAVNSIRWSSSSSSPHRSASSVACGKLQVRFISSVQDRAEPGISHLGKEVQLRCSWLASLQHLLHVKAQQIQQVSTDPVVTRQAEARRAPVRLNERIDPLQPLAGLGRQLGPLGVPDGNQAVQKPPGPRTGTPACPLEFEEHELAAALTAAYVSDCKAEWRRVSDLPGVRLLAAGRKCSLAAPTRSCSAAIATR